MSNDDRDVVVERALRVISVPDHGPDFWSDLEARLPGALTEEPRSRRPNASVRFLLIAAVLAVAVGLAAVVLPRRASDETVRTAAPAAPATTSTTAPSNLGRATPDGAVLAWLDAVGAGDTTTAAALTGPRSAAYVDELTGGAGLEGFLVEAGEGYGAWADSPDRSTTEIELDVPQGADEVTVVIVSGTWTGEGGTQFRTDAIPAVRAATGGDWLVEPWAIDPATGGRIDMVSPSPADEGGFNGLAPDASLIATAPGSGGTFHFSLDDAPPTRVAAQPSGPGVRATFDPPGELASRTHLFLVAYVDDRTISTLAGTFVVEG